jgi:hypothetical protein
MNEFSEIVSVLSNSPSLGYAHTIHAEVHPATKRERLGIPASPRRAVALPLVIGALLAPMFLGAARRPPTR